MFLRYLIYKLTNTHLLIKSKEVVSQLQQCNTDLLYTYLTNRGFMNYPKIIDSSRDEVNVFEYVEDIKLPKE